jgi:predicted homoserine dehydrogenase-like protein
MKLTSLRRPSGEIRIALTGANGGFGRTFIAQLRDIEDIRPTVLVDPDVEAVTRMLAELSIADAERALTAEATHAAASRGAVAVVPSLEAVDWDSVDVLIEATGNVPAGTAYSLAALRHGTHVVMVSKEVDTAVGASLAKLAAEQRLSYLPGDGDQPANLLRLLSWVSAVGLDIVAVGKSSEYDLVFDPADSTVTQNGETVPVPGFADLLTLGEDIPATLGKRAEALTGLKRRAAADYCEMTVVAQRVGMPADVEGMHYPVARTAELADIYAAREDGGIRAADGVVDVFSALRLPDEASFAGGVFAVVRAEDPTTWETLRGKGHVLSRSGAYAAIYWPYHYMGVETPLSVYAAVDGAPARVPSPSTVMAARTTERLAAGTQLVVAGHHHEIAGTEPVMIAPKEDVAAYYVLSGTELVRDLEAGEVIALADVAGADPQVLELNQAALGR